MNQQQRLMEEFDPNYRSARGDFRDFDDDPESPSTPKGDSKSLEERGEGFPFEKKGGVKQGDFKTFEEAKNSTSTTEQQVAEKQRGFPLQKKNGIEPSAFKTFEASGRLVQPENTEEEEVPVESEKFEQEAPLTEVFLSAKDIGKKLESSSEFEEMKSLVARRENALVEITATQQEIIQVRAKVKRLNQELKDAEDIKKRSLALKTGEGQNVPPAVAESIEKVFAEKKTILDAQKANLQTQFDRLSETYENQKRDFLAIEGGINTIRESMRSQLDAEIKRIEIATNLEQEKGNYNTLKEGYDKALEEITELEKQIELFKGLKKIDKQGKKEFDNQIEKNKERIAGIKAQLKTVEKDLAKAEKLLGGIDKRIDSIEGVKKTKGIEESTDLGSNQGSFEGFVFEDLVVEEPKVAETSTATASASAATTQATSGQPKTESRSQTASRGGRRPVSFGQRKIEPNRPKQTMVGRAKSWWRSLFSWN